MPPSLLATLIDAAARLRIARDPWWIITGAAVALHGGPVEPADVDILTSADDARRLLGAAAARGRPDKRYRSAVFGRIAGSPLPIEVMADLELFANGHWRRVSFTTREPVVVDGATLHVPGRVELAALLMAIGRPKDVARAAMLAS